MRPDPDRLLRFWLEETGPDGWFDGGPALDAEIRRRWGLAWRMARAGAFGDWERTAEGTLALLILTDQFPRNMHRGSAAAFATDARAVRVATRAVARGDDLAVQEEARPFVYLPFEPAEVVALQDRAVRLFGERVRTDRSYMPHVRAHREIIRRFGRFPFRNTALGRETTPAEADWLAAGGYMAVVARLS